ncbi:hypothetical protein O7634_24100 [Micromonospora sp. WMMD1120]|uniref:hypothetical protein n=1 Tax=Micromonospora sp. WMMD1120 TaxID=3016106 RepID=UPI002417C9BD|nr:hypothetical protein [Micromonospora sp. WMMD1120]MDG4809845.1 hypothetical protein [Micromonospora sp. WMMD1120]
MKSLDLVLAVVAVAANLAVAGVLLARSRGGTATPRIFGRPQRSPRLRAAMHACLGLGLGGGWLVRDVFPPRSLGDTVVFNVVRVLLLAGLGAALLVAFRHRRSLQNDTAG